LRPNSKSESNAVVNNRRTENENRERTYLPSEVYFELVERLANTKSQPGGDRVEQVKEILGLIADIWPATIREDAGPALVLPFRR
jgi:hypothetical protein